MNVSGIEAPVTSAPLPDLLTFNDGHPVKTPADWGKRRQEVADAILELEYGKFPPTPPGATSIDFASDSIPRTGLPDGSHFRTSLVSVKDNVRSVSFHMDLFLPPGEGPFPVLLYGDGCWFCITDAIRKDIIDRGYVLAVFNRNEMARDKPNRRDCGIWDLYPGGDFSTLAVWAWCYHRAVDALVQLPFVNAKKIAITGHSRGGKTVLLAAATDERIAAVGANNSGCGGAGCYRILGRDCETLQAITKQFPHWFNPAICDYIGRETELPFDQHFLKALVAPRAYWEGTALEDIWSNPPGSVATFEAAREIYRLLGAEDKCAFETREGNHAHSAVSFHQFLDFLGKVF